MRTPVLSAQAEAVRDGPVTARAMVEAALARARSNADLNAFITLMDDAALLSADQVDAAVAAKESLGPLAGVPIVVKDNIDVAGIPTTAGTPAIHYIPERSAPIVERLTAAGAVVIGKTNMHELAFGFTSNNAAFGRVRNPVDPSRMPGGSSGGTAAAVAAGIVGGGLGTDTAGSVRVPASLTGVAGLRPSTDALSAGGIVPSVAQFDVAGPMAVTLADCALLQDVMTGGSTIEARSLDGLRLGLPEPHVTGLSEATAAAFEAAVERLKAGGVEFITMDLNGLLREAFEAGFPIGFHQMRTVMSAYLGEHVPGVDLSAMVAQIASPDVKRVYEEDVIGPGAPSEAAYRASLTRLEAVRAKYLAALDEAAVAALMFPTAPLEAQILNGTGETVTFGGAEVPILQVYLRNIAIASIVGAPGVSIPLPLADGALPIGLALDGQPGGDGAILSAGLAIEAAL